MIANTTEVANRARRRVAFRLLPYLAILYIIAFLDRSNISTAALQMPHDLGFNDRVLGLGSGIFFAGYFLLEIPGAMIVEKWGARRWIARIMVTWGVVSVAMAFIRTEREFYTLRFLLGLAEAGFFPGVLVYLAHWFIHSDRSKSVAAFMSAIPLSFVIGLADFRLAARSPLARPARLALALHPGRPARDSFRHHHMVLSHRLATRRRMAAGG
jgi:MFS transporter, ACS family, tartrate transporter